MTLHKLSAGSGYEYLTRQVAALDSTEKGATPLADYYSAKGESPGRWVGSGLVGIDGLEVGDVVTAEQMKHLFGTGAHPLTGQPLGSDGPGVVLVDGCAAHVGDTVITRRNDRRLATSATDWVKNGDRWIVTGARDGALTVRHCDSNLRTTLPATYVAVHVELGWASTVHTAQGVTADVTHGIVTGAESRQTLYTMLTRGRVENHVHVAITDPAEDHLGPSPALARAATATELLEGVVARDGAAVSATTTREVAVSPESQLHDAATRYGDAVALAASKTRSDLDDAPNGPLPWLVGVPDDLVEHPAWGPYLAARARRVESLAAEVGKRSGSTLPRWTRRYDDVLTPDLRAEIAVWRAGIGVRPGDRSLTGPAPDDDREAAYHRQLQRRVDANHSEALKAWESRIVEHAGRYDAQTTALAKQLDTMARQGVDAGRALDRAASRKPLPVDYPTAALAYRIKLLADQTRQQSSPFEPYQRSPQHNSSPSLGL